LIIFDKNKVEMLRKLSIYKYKSWEELPKSDLAYWLQKTPAERLAAAKELKARARKIYESNPLNKPLYHGRRIAKFHSIAERDLERNKTF
jgi:hypothetical protein